MNDTHWWDEVHGQWPGEIVRDLTKTLPKGFRAAPKVHLGSPFEVDVSAYDLDSRDPDAPIDLEEGGGVATLTALSPTLTIESELIDQDEYEVRIYDVERGRQLVAAVEIISPANKDRPEARELFIGKVASLLRQGVSVSMVDLVTVRQANLYAGLLESLGHSDPKLAASVPPLYAVTVRTRKSRKGRQLVDARFYPMSIGQTLPTIPLWLTQDIRVMLPLETGYEETCGILGIP